MTTGRTCGDNADNCVKRRRDRSETLHLAIATCQSPMHRGPSLVRRLQAKVDVDAWCVHAGTMHAVVAIQYIDQRQIEVQVSADGHSGFETRRGKRRCLRVQRHSGAVIDNRDPVDRGSQRQHAVPNLGRVSLVGANTSSGVPRRPSAPGRTIRTDAAALKEVGDIGSPPRGADAFIGQIAAAQTALRPAEQHSGANPRSSAAGLISNRHHSLLRRQPTHRTRGSRSCPTRYE